MFDGGEHGGAVVGMHEVQQVRFGMAARIDAEDALRGAPHEAEHSRGIGHDQHVGTELGGQSRQLPVVPPRGTAEPGPFSLCTDIRFDRHLR